MLLSPSRPGRSTVAMRWNVGVMPASKKGVWVVRDMTSVLFFFSSRRRHTRYIGDWSSDVCSSDLGNSPPARKLAGCPEVAVKLGSARIVISPSCARASTVRLVRADFGPNAKLIAFWTEIWPPVVGLFVTKVVLPLIFVQLTPRAFSTVRSTSAIFTCRLTWLGVATDIWLIT